MSDPVGPSIEDRLAHSIEELEALRQQLTHLEAALATARRIGIAMGVLMARGGLTEQAAFEALARASQNRNRKLRDVAADVVLTGEL